MAFTAESIAPYLERMNKDYYGRKVWAEQFAGIDASKQASLEGLDSAYSDAVATAYLSSKRNAANIMRSNLISGQKSAMLEANEAALEEAYNSYIQNRAQSVQTVMNTANQQMADVNTALTDQSEMFAKYGNAHLDYLESLWDKYGSAPDSIFSSPTFANYIKPVHDQNGNVALDSNGKPKYELLSRGELENLIWDERGMLTIEGRTFFDQMENDATLYGDSFDTYLRNADPDLYDWATSGNPYDYNAESMAGTFRVLTGRESADETFNATEAFVGMSEGTLEGLFKGTFDALEKLQDELYTAGMLDRANEEGIESAASDFAATISNLIDTLGFTDMVLAQIKEDYGKTYTSVNDFIEDVVDTMKSESVKFYEDADATGWIKDIGELAYGSSGPTRDAYNKAKDSYAKLVGDLVNMANETYQQSRANFYGEEKATGGVIQGYDPDTSKHSTYYNYNIGNNKSVTFLSSAVSTGSKVKDKTGDNFKIKYNGETYKLQVGSETLDAKIVEKLSAKVLTSMGRGLQEGDVFKYDGELWIYTNDGTIRNVNYRFANKKDYDNLIANFV